eukprot:scaffold1368_cov333-Pavlova_lutheri.AAC.25
MPPVQQARCCDPAAALRPLGCSSSIPSRTQWRLKALATRACGGWRPSSSHPSLPPIHDIPRRGSARTVPDRRGSRWESSAGKDG